MLVSDLQRIGAVAVLLLCLSLHGFHLYRSQQGMCENPLIWGEQKQEWLAVEVIMEQQNRGIYFVPHETTLEALMEKSGVQGITGQNNKKELGELGFSAGTTLLFARSGSMTSKEMAAAQKLALGLPLELNTAKEEDLALVPGIGERMSADIVRLRNSLGKFKDSRDLMHVPGIKEKKLQQIRPYLMIKQGN